MKMKNNLLTYGFLLTLLCAGPIAFAADSTNLAKAESLIRAQKYEEAYNLLEPEEFDQAGNLKYDYLLGLAALYSNRPDKATLVFERVLAVNPNYLGVRLDNGRAYYAMGDFARASQEFQTVLTQNPPADIRKQAQEYLSAMQKPTAPKKLSVTAYLETGIGRDSNVASATPNDPVLFPGLSVPQPTNQEVRADNYLTWAIGSELNYQFTDWLGIFAGIDARDRDYSKQNPSDYVTFDGRIGTTFGSQKFVTRITINKGRYFQERDSLRDNTGLNVDFRYQANEHNQISLTTTANRYRFLVIDPSNDPRGNDYNTYLASLGWLNISASQRLLTAFNLNYGGEESAVPNDINVREDGNARVSGARFFAQYAFTDTTSAFLSNGIQSTRYKDFNSKILGNRKDKLTDATAGLNWVFAKDWTLRPLISWIHSSSNFELVDYRKVEYSLNVRVDFR